MIRLTAFIAITSSLWLFQPGDEAHMEYPFQKGEVLKYKLHYGFINAGEAIMSIGNEIQTINGAPCYEVIIQGNSIGMFDLFLTIRDKWTTYIDTTKTVPHKFSAHLREGNYRKHEIVNFKRKDSTAIVKQYHFREEYWKPEEEFEVTENVQDIVSGYYYLRTLDFDQYNEGDIITLKVFFENELFDFRIRYLGTESLKTKIGKYDALVLSPIMPENSLFDGENSIRVWISNDKDKIPLKIKASMFVGAVEVDIKGYETGMAGAN